MSDTGLHHPHPPTRLGVLPTHPLSHTSPSLVPPHPSHTRLTVRGLATTRGGGTTGLVRTSPTACASHRPRGPRPDRLCRSRHCSGSAGCGGKWGSRSIAFPLSVWTDREVGDTVPTAPPLRVRGGSGCGPPPIWDSVTWGRGNMDGLATLNQALMRGLSSCCRIFEGRAHFSTSPPLLVFENNVSLLNPYLDPACTGGGVHALADLPRIG